MYEKYTYDESKQPIENIGLALFAIANELHNLPSLVMDKASLPDEFPNVTPQTIDEMRAERQRRHAIRRGGEVEKVESEEVGDVSSPTSLPKEFKRIEVPDWNEEEDGVLLDLDI